MAKRKKKTLPKFQVELSRKECTTILKELADWSAKETDCGLDETISEIYYSKIISKEDLEILASGERQEPSGSDVLLAMAELLD